ncbi:hypothetical protein [Bacillus marasmi]|uniref:hypothetical protein n=1 Tax=Bacillus marasmi TaxID=1926279 RepID=UPI0011CC25F6|nr:hypothetical protein [Bacillus marasmi]
MLKTKMKLSNPDKILKFLTEMVQRSYDRIKEEEILLCLDCLDVDLYIASTNHDDFYDAVRENFELDEEGEIIDYDSYKELMDELNESFILLHSTSGLFDYFPPGEYTVNDEVREQESEYLAPSGIFYAPFEDAISNKGSR